LGATSLCATTNRGNPMVQYDRISQRWVTSAAFDKLGNIARGYTISSSTLNPSIPLTRAPTQ
jgi:hypothetical protein